MIETLKQIFEILLWSVGILFLLTIIIAIITTPYREIKKKKEIKRLSKEFVDALEKASEEVKKEEKPKKTTKKTTKKEEK